jgi:two-component system, NtrC family, sensor histidine kinase PilS
VATAALRLAPRNLLRWIYLGRLALVLGMLMGAFLVWGEARPEQTLLATVMFLVGIMSVGFSLWWTELAEFNPGRSFLVGQVALDALLVTGVVHITGGGESAFAWLYILVISEGALLVPLSGGLLLAALASFLYFGDIVWGHGQSLTGGVWLQVSVFAGVAAATGLLGDRLRRAGTQLGEMESELRRLRLDTAEILSSISTGVLTVDGRGRLLYLNPAAEALLGVDRDSLTLNTEPALAGIARVAPQLARILQDAMESRTPSFRLRSEGVREGEAMVLGVSTFVRNEPGEALAVTAIFQDITDLERMAVLNRRAERLEAVAELSASLAHEIKNPLASIRSAVEQFTLPRLEDRDRQALTRMVVRESDRLSRLLTDFLDFSRTEVARREPVDLGDTLRDAVAVVQQHPRFEENGLRIQTNIGDATILAAGDLVHRALLNLLLNAVQFSPESGTIEVGLDRPERLPTGLEVERPVRIRIRDHGPGVPPEALERIFDPFYTTREGGSGLGLAVVYRMVEVHQGVILVDNAERGGAEFQIFLPSLPDTNPVGAPWSLSATHQPEEVAP